jgi:hypothetical protein
MFHGLPIVEVVDHNVIINQVNQLCLGEIIYLGITSNTPKENPLYNLIQEHLQCFLL